MSDDDKELEELKAEVGDAKQTVACVFWMWLKLFQLIGMMLAAFSMVPLIILMPAHIRADFMLRLKDWGARKSEEMKILNSNLERLRERDKLRHAAKVTHK